MLPSLIAAVWPKVAIAIFNRKGVLLGMGFLRRVG
jgi:hypothetical protein